VIIFLSYKYKGKIFIIYPFIFIFFITMYIQLVYNKNIEGNLYYDDDKEVYSLWDRLNDDTYGDENNSILDKINKFLKLLFEIERKAEEEYDKVKCEGKFVKRKSKKKCGYNAYDEKVYKITKPGINCRHRAGYSEREFLPKCKLDEKCKIDRDCERGKCHRGTCKTVFECSWDKLDNCDESGCDKLNENVGHDKYKYSNGKCKYNSCNKEQYYNCAEDECKYLGYRFKWDEEDKACVNKDYDVKICSQVTCPYGYSLNENGKDYNCERKLSREDLQEKLQEKLGKDVELNEEDEGFISECNRDNCCKENYTCERYFTDNKTGQVCEGCEDGQDGEGDEACPDNCFFEGDRYFHDFSENGVEKTIYYNYKEEKGTDFFPDGSKKCRGFNCTKEECTQKCEDLSSEDECGSNECIWCGGLVGCTDNIDNTDSVCIALCSDKSVCGGNKIPDEDCENCVDPPSKYKCTDGNCSVCDTEEDIGCVHENVDCDNECSSTCEGSEKLNSYPYSCSAINPSGDNPSGNKGDCNKYYSVTDESPCVPGPDGSLNCSASVENCENIINYCPPGYGVMDAENTSCGTTKINKGHGLSLKGSREFCRKRYSNSGYFQGHCDYPGKGRLCSNGTPCVQR